MGHAPVEADDAPERRRVDAFHDRIGLEAPGAVEASPII